MSAPVFQEVMVQYPGEEPYVLPGGSVVVTTTVLDPDSETITLTVTLTTAAGETTELASKAFVRSDMTLDVVLREMDYEAGWGLERDSSHPGRWIVTAPG